jgi:hypothetical protein
MSIIPFEQLTFRDYFDLLTLLEDPSGDSLWGARKVFPSARWDRILSVYYCQQVFSDRVMSGSRALLEQLTRDWIAEQDSAAVRHFRGAARRKKWPALPASCASARGLCLWRRSVLCAMS